MNRKPKDYKEWRKLLHLTWMQIGQHFTIIINVSPNRIHEKAVITRHVWGLIGRARRIELHLSAEWEARTTGAMTALFEMVEKEVKRRREK